MDLEKIIFLVLAIVLSLFSMYIKSKKQKRSLPEQEEFDHDPYPSEDSFSTFKQEIIFEQVDVTKMSQNSNFHPKNNKKRQPLKNLEVGGFQSKPSDNILQNNDTETSAIILEDFEGTEIQKAFLYSEIFKTTKN